MNFIRYTLKCFPFTKSKRKAVKGAYWIMQ